MPTVDTERMLEQVRTRTGYDVSVTSDPALRTWAGMRAASRALPRHVIAVNPKWAAYGDYLVAAQCAMLLLKWADPGRVPRFTVKAATSDAIVSAVAESEEARALEEAVRVRFCRMIVDGLINQLQSMPAEIMAAEMCFDTCPELRAQQAEVAAATIREMLAALAPRVRSQTPAAIFRRNAAMNAAYGLWWADRAGDRAHLVPFETLGFADAGRDLLDALRAERAECSRYVRTVDRWGDLLDMAGWYQWQYETEGGGGGSHPV